MQNSILFVLALIPSFLTPEKRIYKRKRIPFCSPVWTFFKKIRVYGFGCEPTLIMLEVLSIISSYPSGERIQ